MREKGILRTSIVIVVLALLSLYLANFFASLYVPSRQLFLDTDRLNEGKVMAFVYDEAPVELLPAGENEYTGEIRSSGESKQLTVTIKRRYAAFLCGGWGRETDTGGESLYKFHVTMSGPIVFHSAETRRSVCLSPQPCFSYCSASLFWPSVKMCGLRAVSRYSSTQSMRSRQSDGNPFCFLFGQCGQHPCFLRLRSNRHIRQHHSLAKGHRYFSALCLHQPL